MWPCQSQEDRHATLKISRGRALTNAYGGTISGKGTIASNFINNGGTVVVDSGTTAITKAFSNSGLIQLTNFTANLTGGAIANTGSIGGRGQVGNSISNSGIIEAIGGTLTLGGAVTNNPGGLMTAGDGGKLLVSAGLNPNAGVINLTGGTFDNNNHALSNAGQISGYGAFRTGGLSNIGAMTLSGGTTTVQGDVTNQAPGQLTIAYNQAIFTGAVTNYGTVKTTDTTVTWAGSFTNSGAYFSDPSVNSFSDLTVSPSGNLVGGAGDLFEVSNDFINQSTQTISWNTQQAIISFISGADQQHDLYLAGKDMGAASAGYAHNFAWGILDLTAPSLTLRDGNTEDGGALYLGSILGVLLEGSQVTNIFGNGFNLYYNPNLGDNDYLGGLTYGLKGGGLLMPGNPVPVPPSVVLFLSGLVGLLLLGRRRH